jgi:hypothetical protein
MQPPTRSRFYLAFPGLSLGMVSCALSVCVCARTRERPGCHGVLYIGWPGSTLRSGMPAGLYAYGWWQQDKLSQVFSQAVAFKWLPRYKTWGCSYVL